MMPTRVSSYGRFIVLDGLHLDRNLFEALVRWATNHDLRIQDAVQFALCIFRDADRGRPRGDKAVRRN